MSRHLHVRWTTSDRAARWAALAAAIALVGLILYLVVQVILLAHEQQEMDAAPLQQSAALAEANKRLSELGAVPIPPGKNAYPFTFEFTIPLEGQPDPTYVCTLSDPSVAVQCSLKK